MTGPERAKLLTPDLLARLADAMGVPLARDRAAQLAPAVEGMFGFTKELDEVDTSQTVPATVFVLPEA